MSERSERIIKHVASARSAELLIRTPPQAVAAMSERSERIIKHVASARSAELLIRTPPEAVAAMSERSERSPRLTGRVA
jgi:hypothetical protein